MSSLSSKQYDVEHVLDFNPRATYDDKWLLMLVWEAQGLVLTGEQQSVFLSKDLSSAESITRARRWFQQRGQYMPPAGVQTNRRNKAETVRTEIHKTPPTELI